LAAQRCDPPFSTLRPIRTSGVTGSRLSRSRPPRGLAGTQQALPRFFFFFFFFFSIVGSDHQSAVHSQTLPIMSNRP